MIQCNLCLHCLSVSIVIVVVVVVVVVVDKDVADVATVTVIVVVTVVYYLSNYCRLIYHGSKSLNVRHYPLGLRTFVCLYGSLQFDVFV